MTNHDHDYYHDDCSLCQMEKASVRPGHVLTEREILLANMDWPADPQELCLQCNKKRRNAFSWFCGIGCEDDYVIDSGVEE